jgi:hypothetical protein
MEPLSLLGLGLALLFLVVLHLGLKQRTAQRRATQREAASTTSEPEAATAPAAASETEGASQRGRRLRDGPHPRYAARLDVGCSDEGKCWFDIVGESSYQGTLRLIAGERLLNEEPVNVDCLIAPEPENPHDAGALAVYIEGSGKVGYFSREDLAGAYGALRDRLAEENAAGYCRGKLTGGWEEDISIGVRLALMRPSQARGGSDSAPTGPRPSSPQGPVPPDDWFLRHRILLPPGKGWLSLIEENDCQAELRRLAQDRDVARETVGFTAVLVPADGGVIVCAEGGSPVGRLGRSDTARFADLVAHLEAQRAVATCGGWVTFEHGRLGAKVTVPGPKSVMEVLRQA